MRFWTTSRSGLSPLFGAVLLAAIAVTVSAIVGGWLPAFSEKQTGTLVDSTKTQLQCQFASIFIRNVTYNCSADCSAGVAHNLTLTVVNSGKVAVSLGNLYVLNTTGSTFTLEVNQTTLDVGSVVSLTNISTGTCNGINRSIEKVIISSPDCPGTATDSLAGSLVNFVSC